MIVIEEGQEYNGAMTGGAGAGRGEREIDGDLRILYRKKREDMRWYRWERNGGSKNVALES